MKLLIIEDEILFGELLKDVLSDFGNIYTAKSTEHADKLLHSHQFDLIVSDYHLENGENSLNLFSKNKLLIEHIPIILISGLPTEEMLEKSAGLDINIFLKKPIDCETLIERIKIILFDKIKKDKR